MEIKKKELFTFPSKKPRQCIDYVWVKGKNIEIKNYEVFGDKTHTDHLGIKASIDIQSL
jgi:endonuclease/exonuclease/phosphatase family metal-dependent hydrolase